MTNINIKLRQRPVVPEHLVTQVLDHLRAGTTQLCDDQLVVPAELFTSREIGEVERERVFGRVPMIVAHSGEVPAPYAFMTKRLPNNEVIIARDGDARVHVLVNMCRHRGATVAMESSGHCRVFSCPYHGWSYNPDGSLRATTYAESFGPVDMANLGLVEIPSEERHGFIWVVDNPVALIDVAAHLGPETDRNLAAFGLEELVCYRSRSFPEPINWKVMLDAFVDNTHIRFVHPQTAGKVIHANFYVIEDHGQHCRFVSPRKSTDRWLEVGPEPGTSMAEYIIVTHYLGPNTILLQLDDNYQLLTFYPVSDDPTECCMEMKLMVPRQEDTALSIDEWTAKWEKNWGILEAVLLREDFPVLRGIQKAHSSKAATPTMFGRNEILNQIIHREIGRLRECE